MYVRQLQLLVICTSVLWVLLSIVRMIKSRRMRWAAYVLVARIGERRSFWWGNLRERDHLGDPGVEGRMILRWIFRKGDVGVWTGSSWLRIGRGDGH